MAKRAVSQLDVAGKRVLVRVDFNIPIEQGVEAIASYDQRLRATLPTIRYLIDQRCRVILCSHLGRPGGKEVDALRLAPVGDRLATLLGVPVKCLSETIGPGVEESVASMKPGEVALLENLRFHAGEEKNDPEFAHSIAGLADCFVMDAFAVTHRAHASTVGVPGLLPSAMGLLVQREVESLGQALDIKDENKPLAALMGGAKVSDKIMVLENLLGKLDHLIVGGGMSVTFLKAQGYDTGASSIEEDRLDFAKEVLSRATQLGVQIHLPGDVVVADRFAAD
ncbi:MAG TPA: phosphoglycerate kinase, partial [Dehalococcoidia bacterium]|nr:phosphoglycerate kinase [Dehalococcoidia bacterium]